MERNGLRARWANEKGIREVVHATDPDLLCFLEAKTDATNLLKLEGFEEWLQKTGFRKLYCYWTQKVDDDKAKAYGNEGIIIFSKSACERVIYGMGDQEFDQQARIVT